MKKSFEEKNEFEKEREPPEQLEIENLSDDIEAQGDQEKRSYEVDRDPYLVSWEGPDDPKNPRNWTFGRKWAAVFVVSSFTFISPVSSSIVAPALPKLSADLGIKSEFESQMVLSIFILSYAIGPLIFGPLSEVYGRVRVLQTSNLLYLIFNLACGFAKSGSQMLAFRFLAGFGGSAMLALGGGILADCFAAEQRGQAIGLYMLGPLLGPAVGPIAGGFITQSVTWRWCFWATTVLCALVQLSGLLFLQETYAPILLQRKVMKLRKEEGDQRYHSGHDEDKKLLPLLGTALMRPFRLLMQPIIQVLAIWNLYNYGLMYLILSTFPTLWTERYGESIGIAGLNYISLGLGFWISGQITAPLNDKIYRSLKRKNGGVGKPEFRTPLMFIGAGLLPIGIFIYGWTAQERVHWIAPNIGAALFAAGNIIIHQCSQTYILDCYTRYAASGTAAVVVLRSLAGFGFPLFAPYLYQKLDYGWGNSLLGFIAVFIGIPAPFLFWKFGERLRARSQFAAGGS
ncbi:MFS general substrate transporter [Microthyrium microscopicum]|uniref:MFS general substrate transporter n=1 Tax=Microthyrium microscopicum TaxID=703497 RepID=A0A6A6TXQ8_9PEZI|nr:MFS general substrate transporter [Microthyrium microscopicum]